MKCYVTPGELNNAEEGWIKKNQTNYQTTSKKYKVLTQTLNIKMDEREILWCERRIEKAPLPYETKSPMLISPYHPLAKLMIEDVHHRKKQIKCIQKFAMVI